MHPYIAKLRRKAAEERARREAEAAVHDPRAKLKGQILQWYSSLPPENRPPNYLMEELARWLRARPQELGIALRELGWRCERRWRKGEAYRHYWIPPDVEAPQDANAQASNSTVVRDEPTT
jgi:hypothetical protein